MGYGQFKNIINEVRLPYRGNYSILITSKENYCMICGLSDPENKCEKCNMWVFYKYYLQYHKGCLLFNEEYDSTCLYCKKGNNKDCILCPNNTKGFMMRLPLPGTWGHTWCVYGTKFYEKIINENDKITNVTCSYIIKYI